MGTGMDDWVQSYLAQLQGRKFAPDQTRDSAGRFSTTGSAALDAGLDQREGKIRKARTESAFVLDDDGNEILKKRGDATSVEFTDDEVKAMAGKTFTHNHPSGQSFSVNDIALAADANLKEVRATGIDKETGKPVVYRMKPPKKGWPPSGMIHIRYTQMAGAVTGQTWRDIRDGRLTVKQAEARHHDRIWKDMAAKFRMDYSKEVAE